MRLLVSILAVGCLISFSSAQAVSRGPGGHGVSVGKSSLKSGYRSNAGARRAEQRRHLLEGAPSQPSPKIAQVIRERENSGPGWVGTAFLIALLSRHDLSSADRSWIQGRIDALHAEGNKEDDLLDAVASPVTFEFAGLKPKLEVGDMVSVLVSAKSKGAAVRVSCFLNEATVVRSGQNSQVSWEPSAPGAALLTCEAANHQSRRLLRVAPAGSRNSGWRQREAPLAAP